MSSQLEDHYNEATETVARLLYARNRTPREPGWADTDQEIRDANIKDVRAVVDLWLRVSAPCPWCMGTGRTADGHPCTVCGGTGMTVTDGEDR